MHFTKRKKAKHKTETIFFVVCVVVQWWHKQRRKKNAKCAGNSDFIFFNFSFRLTIIIRFFSIQLVVRRCYSSLNDAQETEEEEDKGTWAHTHTHTMWDWRKANQKIPLGAQFTLHNSLPLSLSLLLSRTHPFCLTLNSTSICSSAWCASAHKQCHSILKSRSRRGEEVEQGEYMAERKRQWKRFFFCSKVDLPE